MNNTSSGLLTSVRSRHMVKAGFDALRTQSFQPYANNVRGTFNFLGRWTNDPYGDYMLGLLNNTSRQVTRSGDGGYPGAQDARNLALERGRADFDNRHSLTMNVMYDMPFLRRNLFLGGWQPAATGRVYSGQPFTFRVSNVQLDQGKRTGRTGSLRARSRIRHLTVGST